MNEKMSLTDQQLADKNISTNFSGISDETWEALARDKRRRKFLKKFNTIFVVIKKILRIKNK